MSTERGTFLGLPPDVRQRIYLHVGVSAGRPIYIMPRGPRTLPSRRYFTRKLLYLCKLIHSEIIYFICSRNRLIVHEKAMEFGLRFLRRLPPRTCYELSHLHVQLYSRSIRGPIENPKPNDEQIMMWQEAATHVLSHTKPQKLRLRLVCDTGEDKELTSAILKPLLDFPGILGEFEVRIHSRRNTQFCILAREIYTQVMCPDVVRPFNFTKLPPEVRRNILTYTDLVAPSCQVQWSASAGFYIDFSQNYCENGREIEQLLYGCQFRRCKVRNDYANTPSPCSFDHSGYSPHCRCWMPPQSLMFVSRQMYEEASDVFYSCNRIVALPYGSCFEPDLYTLPLSPRLDISVFITRFMWPEILCRLRYLEILFPPLGENLTVEEPIPAYSDWISAVDHLKKYANFDGLTIVAHIRFPNHMEKLRKSANWFESGTVDIINAHANLLAPLRALRQMSRFFVRLEHPYRWTGATYGSLIHCQKLPRRRCTSCQYDDLEVWLEKFVMGGEYDSAAVGKAEDVPSEWVANDWSIREENINIDEWTEE
ncbi:uncharacterized protein F4822DRAFT_413776 [Hypoxylon trugodes]|uniref:uncharacterized protein n=1 Tax=Hypoxylon trugodes TaxID=326681 RepID=UPI00218F272F|nr:uncharacterized protein F4822DRAFT_413776 [Hypoxylon trugodes]KAI1385633.1 hypothetical protein F4822DRAFT_413776 [Hypoxylon trugodes]